MRDRILDAATAQFVRRGYDGVSMADIAAELNITKPALYYHFAGKADLLAEVFTSYLDELAAVVEASRDIPGSADRLRAIVHGLFDRPAERRAIIRLAMHDIGRLDEEYRTRFATAYHERFLDRLGDLFARGAAAGEFVDKDPDLLVRLLLGILYPLFTPPTAGAAEADSADVDDLLDVFLCGLVVRPAD
ncbi:MAG: TetR/AcrR family transcriptional regulator [Propionibacteriaceae bacterium]|jgi:AcrR family transcriptional regulator|nr:TetR/AcrR family transcriptional regulator [Propionibacteriaceae bacterium]